MKLTFSDYRNEGECECGGKMEITRTRKANGFMGDEWLCPECGESAAVLPDEDQRRGDR